MKNQSGIYEIVNTVNGKRYIGSAVNLSRRWKDHRRLLRQGAHVNGHLQVAWDKHTESAFKFLPILTCAKSMLLFYEQQLITKAAPEYNICKVAGSTLGVPCGEEKKKKISKAHKGKTLTDEHKAAIAAAGTGRFPTEETLEKLRKAQRARGADPAVRAAIAARQMGHEVTPEAREKMRVAKLGKPANLSAEGKERRRQAIILSNQTRGVSEETREKMRTKSLGRKMSANALALQTERMKGNSYRKGTTWSPELRERIMATRAARKAAAQASA